MSPRGMKWLLFTLSSLALANAQPTSDSAHTPVQKQGIKWAPCPHPGNVQLECATLAVPLNYTAGASSETIDLQLTKVNALKQPSKGSILFNPGGPGTPGRSFIRARERGPALMYMTGGEHDLVSFNPRGTGDTIPMSCQKNIHGRDERLDTPSKEASELDTTELPVWSEAWASAKANAELCANDEYGSLIGTTFAARDMMKIVDALGEDGLLRYWGISYGTVLGATVAAMFPDRMDRIVLDGVVNPAQWWSGEMTDSSLDTEAAIDGFFANCVENLEQCILARQGSSASDLREQFDNLIRRLTVRFGGGQQSFAVKSNVAHDLMSTAFWPGLADYLHSLFIQAGVSEDEHSSTLDGGHLGSKASPQAIEIASTGIRCSDSHFRAHSIAEVLPLMRKIEEVAPTLGVGDMSNLITCTEWKLRAEERFTDAFENIQTKSPILFIGNTYDPRTPLASARNASVAFPGSALLTLDGYGHSSLAHPSLCIGKAVKSYFINGTLPEEETICQPSVPPFRRAYHGELDDIESLLWANGAKDDDDEALLAAWTHAGSEISRLLGLI